MREHFENQCLDNLENLEKADKFLDVFDQQKSYQEI
jgi:hypothetical protein